MTRKYDLPFKVGQEVEVKFNESGYRGAWFRCRILEIKDSTSEFNLFLAYLDFPDEAHAWTRVRQADPAAKPKPWLNSKKPLIWMVRPVPPIVHESDVEKYQEDIRMGRKNSGLVHIYHGVYMVGDAVDWWTDDCFWHAQIIEIDYEKNEAKLKFPPPPHGEGSTGTAPFKELRPSFSWSPNHQWRQVWSKRREARNRVENNSGDKRHAQLVHLSGKSITAVESVDRCDSFSSGEANSGCEPGKVVFCARSQPGEGSHNDSGSDKLILSSDRFQDESMCELVPVQSTSDCIHETMKHIVHKRIKLRNRNGTSGAQSFVEQEKTEEAKLKNGTRRMVRFNSSFNFSYFDEEEEGNWSILQNSVAVDGARSAINDSEMVSEYELVDVIPRSARAIWPDASAVPLQLVATHLVHCEKNSMATFTIANEMAGVFENTGGFGQFNTPVELFRKGIAIGVDDVVSSASEDPSHVKSILSDALTENAVSPLNNADDCNDVVSEAAFSATRYDTVICSSAGKADSSCAGVAELDINYAGSEGLTDDSTLVEPVADQITAIVECAGMCTAMKTADELGDSVPKVDVDATREVRPEAHLLVSAGKATALKDPPCNDSTTGLADGLADARAEVFPLTHDSSIPQLKEIIGNILDSHCVPAEVPLIAQTVPDRETSLLLAPDENEASFGNSAASLENTAGNDNEVGHEHDKVITSPPSVVDSDTEENSTPLVSTCVFKNEKHPDDVGLLDTVSESKHCESEVWMVKGRCKQKSDDSDLGVAIICALGADLKHCRDDEHRDIVCNPLEDDDTLCDLRQEQANRSVTKFPIGDASDPPNGDASDPPGDASDPPNGQMKLLSHRSCVAIKKAIKVGHSRKRRLEKEFMKTEVRKRVCQIGPNERGKLPVIQTDGFLQECLALSVPSTPLNDERRISTLESIVKCEPGTYEQDSRMHVVDDSLHETMTWVLALPRIREGSFPAVVEGSSVTTPSGTEHPCRPDGTEGSLLEDELDALEKLTARVHVLGAQLSAKVQNRKKVVWKISDGSLFLSGDGDGVNFDGEANDLDSTHHSGDCSFPKSVLERQPGVTAESRTVSATPHSGLDYIPGRLPRARKPRSRRIYTKGGTKRTKSVRTPDICKAQSLKLPETKSQLLLVESGNVSSKVKSGRKRKYADIMDLEFECKKMRADVRMPVVEAVRNTATLSAEVDLPRMRGSINNVKRKSARLKKPRTSMKCSLQEKTPDVRVASRTKLLNRIMFEQEQELEDPFCGHIEQESLGKSSLTESATKAHLSSVSSRATHSSGKLDFEFSDEKCEENKIKLLVNGSWCIKAETVDGKFEWIGNFPTKGDALSAYDIVNASSFPIVKEVQPLGHASCSLLRDPADGDNLSLELSLNEKQTKCSTFDRRTDCNASEFSSSAHEPNVGGTVLIVEGIKETFGDVSRLGKSLGADEQEGACQDARALEKINKIVEGCEQDLSAISTKEDAGQESGPDSGSLEKVNKIVESCGQDSSAISTKEDAGQDSGSLEKVNKIVESREQDSSAISTKEDAGQESGQDSGSLEKVNKIVESCGQDSSAISTKEDAFVGIGTSVGVSLDEIMQGRSNSEGGALAPHITDGLLGSSSCEKVVKSDKDIQSLGIAHDIPLVVVEVSEPQVEAAAGSAPYSWIHDAIKRRPVVDALDHVNENIIETTEERLWRGMHCSSQGPGSGPPDLVLKRMQLFVQSRMQFEALIDGDSKKTILSTGKSGEQIYIGHFKTEREVDVARKVLSRCKRELAKAMASLESRVLDKERSSSLKNPAEVGDIGASPTCACHATEELIKQSLMISKEGGQSVTRSEINPKPSLAAGVTRGGLTSAQISCHQTLQVTHDDGNPNIQASAASVTDHLPSPYDRQISVNGRTVGGPPDSLTHQASVQNLIILDDDDDNEMHINPVSIISPRSTMARTPSAATPVGPFSGNLKNNFKQSDPSQSEVTGLGNRASRTNGLLNDMIPSYCRREQEVRCHLTVGSSGAEQSWVRPVLNHALVGNTGAIQRVGPGCGIPDAQTSGNQHLRQEIIYSQQTASVSPILFGSVVSDQQPVIQYGGHFRAIAVNSIGRRVENPPISLPAMNEPARLPASHAYENRLREVGNSTCVRTVFNTSASAAARSNLKRKVYKCCPNISSCEDDFKLFQGLQCGACNQQMHTQCALASRQLFIQRNPTTGQEQPMYICMCGRAWGILPKILLRLREFIYNVWIQQSERLKVPLAAREVAVSELKYAQDLRVIMRKLHDILSGAESPAMSKILSLVKDMNYAMPTNANKVNYWDWIDRVDHCIGVTGGLGHQTAGRG